MPKNIIFWGVTGQAKVLRECIAYFDFELIALFDNDNNVKSPFTGVPLFYGKQGFESWLFPYDVTQNPLHCLVAIGGTHGRDRYLIQKYLIEKGLKTIVAVHPRAFVASGVEIGPGSQVLANASVCVDARLGEACIVNTAALVDHDCFLGAGVHIGPGAHLAGEISIGDFSMIGAGAVILPKISIGRNVIVGAGAVVTKDISDNVVLCGNPARVLRQNLAIGGSVWK